MDRGELDLAVVKGGLSLGDNTHIRQVAALDIEAFHLLVKEPIFLAWEQNFNPLKGKRININKPSTGTHHWSLDILQFAGLTPTTPDSKGSFTPTMLGNPELLEILAGLRNASDAQRGLLLAELPDAILFADLVPSSIVHSLVNLANYRLVPLDFGPAYIQHFHAGHHPILDPTVAIEVVTIPAFTYGVGPHSVPPHTCSTLGVRGCR